MRARAIAASTPNPMPFKNRREAENYVDAAFRQALTEGWSFERSSPERLWWTIKRDSVPPGEWSWQDYHLHVSEDLQWFMLTYGNNDIGPGSLGQELQCARIISARSLAHYPLSECIRYVVLRCKPNEWGYT